MVAAQEAFAEVRRAARELGAMVAKSLHCDVVVAFLAKVLDDRQHEDS